ncbi:MAG: PD40 domain-containing protein [Gemmatimonadetes bacterium]|nr:PD40 domain-containing protein [Gemmatimonadota bacterium]
MPRAARHAARDRVTLLDARLLEALADRYRIERELGHEGRLPLEEARLVALRVAETLAYAHDRGIVHRDIKPENVMLSGRHALVMDFGVAKAVNEASGRSNLTTLGVALGTPSYMAPEQATADPLLDHRVDIYALGVVGYELLAGRPPFVGASPQQVLAAHVTQAPESLGVRRPQLAPALVHVIMKALEKRPADRWQSAEEMLAQLEPLVMSSGGLTPAETRPYAGVKTPSPWPKRAAVGVGVLAIAGAVAWALTRPPATAALASNTQLTRAAGKEEFPTISPDGKSVAYIALGPTDTAPRVELRRVDGGDAVQIGSARRPVGWSPAGDRLLLGTTRGLESRPTLGGQGTIIDPRSAHGAWSPDGAHVVRVVGDSLVVSGANNEAPRLLARGLTLHSPAWSPDGKWIAYVSGNSQYFDSYNVAPSQVWIVPAAGGMPWPITSADVVHMSPTWAADSRRLLIVSAPNGIRDIYQVNLSADGKPQGAPVRISIGLNPSLISLSADGTQLAYSVATYHTNIWRVRVPTGAPVSTRTAEQVTNERQVIEGFEISRDGKWLVFDSDRQGVFQIYRMPLAGGPVQQVTRDSNPSFKPTISPDGREIAFHTITKGLRRIFVVAAEGGRPVQLSPGAIPDERNAFWSPDGRSIGWQLVTGDFGSLLRPRVQVATRDASGGWGPAVTVPFTGRSLLLAWADQGTAIVGIDSSGYAVAQPVAGGPARRLAKSGRIDSLVLNVRTRQAARSQDGATVLVGYRADPAGIGAANGVLAIRLVDGTARKVLLFDEPARPHGTSSFGVAESGGWLYFTLSDPQSDIWVATVTGLKK